MTKTKVAPFYLGHGVEHVCHCQHFESQRKKGRDIGIVYKHRANMPGQSVQNTQ